MIKALIKKLVSSKKLAKYSSEGIQKAINSSGKQDLIAKYGNIADKATDIQKQLTDWLVDGKIDDIEKEQIQQLIEPLFQKMLEMI